MNKLREKFSCVNLPFKLVINNPLNEITVSQNFHFRYETQEKNCRFHSGHIKFVKDDI